MRQVARLLNGDMPTTLAQRDLIDLTLVEAAERGGQQALSEALRSERAMLN